MPPPAFLLRLSHRLLAKAERSAGTAPVRLSLDQKVAPELHDAPDAEQVDLLRMQLADLHATGWVALQQDAPRAFASFGDCKPRLELRNFDALAAWSGYTPRAQRWRQLWRSHLAKHWTEHPQTAPTDPSAVLDHLARNPLLSLEDLPVETATASLVALATLCRSGQAMPLREASARAFQGRSKVLDHREELLRLLGATATQFSEAPIQLLLAPPSSTRAGRGSGSDEGNVFRDVLFVENLITFEQMADHRAAAWRDSLLVYAAGFRGSARRLRSRSGCRLYLRAPTEAASLPAIERWLFPLPSDNGDGAPDVPVRFFGDLDLAGMQILTSLREVFRGASAWRPGYDYLAAQLAAGAGHLPELAAKAQQSDPGNTGCPYADGELLPLLRRLGHFIDQEAFAVHAMVVPSGSP